MLSFIIRSSVSTKKAVKQYKLQWLHWNTTEASAKQCYSGRRTILRQRNTSQYLFQFKYLCWWESPQFLFRKLFSCFTRKR